MGHQSLYRRYRSQNFSEIKGQPVVTNALRAAVAEGRYGHAYLFSGPRGTGKTSTARVLAKALNCENPTNGEPCGSCQSCQDIEAGRSFDLHELDAASNNKVDDIRDLIARVNLGSPGRTKVYILDEVHMLSSGAENALLKTLEEPPDHVVFVLATTEPQKVVPTIRSRTQHFQFHLLPAAELEAHLRWVIDDAGLDVDEDGIAWALRAGGGSARDTLSALELVVASGGAPEAFSTGADLCRAIGTHDPAAAILTLQEGLASGAEPRTIGEDLLTELRNAFLASMGAPLPHLHDTAAARARDIATLLGPSTITRSLEMIGAALVEARQAPDPRVPIEVALLHLARERDDDLATLSRRLDELEAAVADLRSSGPVQPPLGRTPGSPPPPTTPSRPPASRSSRRTGGRSAPNAESDRSTVTSSDPPDAPSRASAAESPQGGDGVTGSFTLADVTAVLDAVLESLSQRVRARFRQGTAASVEEGVLAFSYPNQLAAERATDVQGVLEEALSARLGTPVRISVVVDQPGTARTGGSRPRPAAPPPADSEDDIGPVSELVDAEDQANSMVDRLTAAFPGATLIDPPANP